MSQNRGSFPKNAIANNQRVAFEELLPHGLSSASPVVIGRNEKGDRFYFTEGEWLEGGEAFRRACAIAGVVTSESTTHEKLQLFRSLFAGRPDVHAHGYRRKDGGISYAPVCANEWVRGICPKYGRRGFKCADCNVRAFPVLSDWEILDHIRGESPTFRDVLGSYVLDANSCTKMLVVDFDEEDWKKAALAFSCSASSFGLDPAIERSRSGNGAHVWLFFSESIPGRLARDLGSKLLSDAMSKCREIGFDSYDRMFPAQDTLPEGGFGNLISLPFQGIAKRQGNSVFVGSDFSPYEDQWHFLSTRKRASLKEVENVVGKNHSGLLGPLAFGGAKSISENVEEWSGGPISKPLSKGDFPQALHIKKCGMLLVAQEGLSDKARNRFIRLAAFANPEFYRAQAMHQSVFGKPRIVSLAEEREGKIALPRGCEEQLRQLLRDANVGLELEDARFAGNHIDVSFRGKLRDEQLVAASKLLKFEDGILSAPTGFGKTVVGVFLIAAKRLPTLVIVPRTALLTQWQDKLETFLEIRQEPEPLLTPSGKISKRKRPKIGILGGGKDKRSGLIDIAMYQSLSEKDPATGEPRAKELLKEYGLVIVDECHHGAAPQLERVLKGCIARNVYGLSATPKRADGLEKATYLLCGPIRVAVDPKEQAQRDGYRRILRPRFTNVKIPLLEKGTSFNQVLDKLCKSEKRNRLIVDDVVASLLAGRYCLVISKRKEHARKLCEMLQERGADARLLVGDGSASRRKAALDVATSTEAEMPFALVATESYLGEGFDMPVLDALFLTTPISWDGNVVQQSGRLHRKHEGTFEVTVFDYVDVSIPMLERMYKKRLKSYARIGYQMTSPSEDVEGAEASCFVGRAEFENRFAGDIASAQKTIRIQVSRVSEGMAKRLRNVVADACSRGVDVTCEIREIAVSDSGREKAEWENSRNAGVEILQASGCRVVEVDDCVSGLAVFDEQLVWYGTLPLLAYPKEGDCSIRFSSAEVAEGLIPVAESVDSCV